MWKERYQGSQEQLFIYQAIHIWNDLPVEAMGVDIIMICKIHLDIYMDSKGLEGYAANGGNWDIEYAILVYMDTVGWMGLFPCCIALFITQLPYNALIGQEDELKNWEVKLHLYKTG